MGVLIMGVMGFCGKYLCRWSILKLASSLLYRRGGADKKLRGTQPWADSQESQPEPVCLCCQVWHPRGLCAAGQGSDQSAHPLTLSIQFLCRHVKCVLCRV